MKFAVCVPKHFTIGEMKAKLAALADVPVAELQLADIYNSRIWQLLADDRSVGSIRDSDVTFAFQIIPQPPKPAPVPAAAAPAPAADGDSKPAEGDAKPAEGEAKPA